MWTRRPLCDRTDHTRQWRPVHEQLEKLMGRKVMRAIVFRTALFLCAFVSSFAAVAADYPNRPVHVIVGFTAGSGVDILARIVGQKLAEATGQPFIIENRPGAGSNIGTRFAAAAEPDGYTLFVATIANAINATLYKKLTFDVRSEERRVGKECRSARS